MAIRIKFPNDPAEVRDFREACHKYVLPGFLPAAPIFNRATRIATAGSCFAENLSEAARANGMASTHLHFSEAGASAPGFLIKLREAISGKIGGNAADILRKTDLLVLTLGIGFGLFVDDKFRFLDELTKEEQQRAQWRYLSPGEIARDLVAIVQEMKAAQPNISVVVTLSPLPINSALTHPSVFATDCVSKSLQRVAIEAVMGDQIPSLTYWPSFEMVRWLGPHRGQTFGIDGADNRHISPAMTAEIMKMFFEAYFTGP